MWKRRTKYVAEGFVEDAGKLMIEYENLNSVVFKDFADVWKKRHFSFIFMGRPDPIEYKEFVNETYRLTMLYFKEDSFMKHVGAVYMLYSLFHEQVVRDDCPQIRIRIEMEQFQMIESLRLIAIEKKIHTLRYVIDNLRQHAFICVGNQTLRGPLIAGIPTDLDVKINLREEELEEKTEAFVKDSHFEQLRDLHNRYIETKKKVPPNEQLKVVTQENIYEKAIKRMQTLGILKPEEQSENIGGARSKIKAAAFNSNAKKRIPDATENLNKPVRGTLSKFGKVTVKGDPVKKGKEPKRPRKEDKRPGRPRKTPIARSPPEKNSSDEEIDISHLLTEQRDLCPPEMIAGSSRVKTKRGPYYQATPPRVSSSESDVDDPSTM